MNFYIVLFFILFIFFTFVYNNMIYFWRKLLQIIERIVQISVFNTFLWTVAESYPFNIYAYRTNWDRNDWFQCNALYEKS